MTGQAADDTAPILEVKALCFGFPTRTDFLGPLDLSVFPGQLLGVIGPNGAGKSTLLRLLVGLLAPNAGEVRLRGQRLSQWSAADRARVIAFLPQQPPASPFVTAGQVVLMGRFPHRRYHLFESSDDHCAARRAMEATGTGSFADRPMHTLSGGEAQRVHLAAALAQQPQLLVLDEPTAALDLYHQLNVFELLRSCSRSQDLAAIVVTHDLNLAGRHCDRLALLDDGQIVAAGEPGTVLRPDVLAQVYGVTFVTHPGSDGDRGWVLPVARAVRSTPSTEVLS